MKIEDVVNELNFKIEKLGTLYSSSISEVRALKEEIINLQRENEFLKMEYKNLKEKSDMDNLAELIKTGNSTKNAKSHIRQLLREVDNCIALIKNIE